MIQISDFQEWKRVAGIYGIKNTFNGKWYVGSTCGNAGRGLEQRLKEHIHFLRCGKHCNRHLQAAWNKYGEEVFAYFVLEQTENDEDILFDRELCWMTELRSVRDGYNISQNPRYCAVPFTEERRQKQGERTKELWHNDEYRNKMTVLAKERMSLPENKAIAAIAFNKMWANPEMRKNNIARHRGKKRSEQERKKQSIATLGKPKYKLRGRPLSEKTKQKLSEAMSGRESAFKGHHHTEENKKILSEKAKGNKYCVGRVLSEETKKKIGIANTGNQWTDEQKCNKRMKPPSVGKYKGVSYNKSEQKYKASIYCGKEVFLGWFEDLVEAAENYDYYALKIYGRKQCYINFQDKDYTNFTPRRNIVKFTAKTGEQNGQTN